MARFLIVGDGSNALALARALEGEDHVVSAVAHADRGALEHVAIVCWLSGCSPEHFLLRSVDSSMRGFVYQAGEHEHTVLETTARNSIPVVVLTADPLDLDAWIAQTHVAVQTLLEGRDPGAQTRYAQPYIPQS